jgi:hypothetical protein
VTAVLASLAQRTETGTAKVALTMTMEIKGFPGVPGPAGFGSTGVFDYAAKRGSVTADFSSMDSGFGVSSPPGMDKWEVVFDGADTYFALPPELVKNGKKWAKITEGSLFTHATDSGSGSNDGWLNVLAGYAAPSSGIELFKGLGTTGTVVGHETIRGIATTHYRTTLEPPKTPGALGPGLIPMFGASMGGPSSTPVDVWVDDEGRLAKMTVTYDLTQVMKGFASGPFPKAFPDVSPSPGDRFKFFSTMTFEIYDYGAPVSIVVPPADQVTDAANVPDPAPDVTSSP